MTFVDKGGWIRLESVQGGWMVNCRLCGKRFKRSYYAADTNYAEAERASTRYAASHWGSEAHRGAVAVFHQDVADLLAASDAKAHRVFFSDEEIRRREARRAAETIYYRDQRMRQGGDGEHGAD